MGKIKILSLGLIAGLLVMVAFIGGCTTPAQETQQGEVQNWLLVGYVVVIFAVLYFLMIRPQRKRRKEHQELVEGLRSGDRIITAGGIYGIIESVSEDSVVIKVESGTTIRVARGSVVIKRQR